jgi:[acyl-carrier-protein] S-malonyltransferase
MSKMIEMGAEQAIEVGPGKVLQGLFKKVDRAFSVSGASIEG